MRYMVRVVFFQYEKVEKEAVSVIYDDDADAVYIQYAYCATHCVTLSHVPAYEGLMFYFQKSIFIFENKKIKPSCTSAWRNVTQCVAQYIDSDVHSVYVCTNDIFSCFEKKN